MKSRIFKAMLIATSAMLIVVITSMILIMAYGSQARGDQVRAFQQGGQRAPLVWELQTQYYDQNSAGTFGINGILVTHNELYLFYAIAPTIGLNGVPQVTAQTCAPLTSCSPMTVNSVQSLGSLQSLSNLNNRYPLGVIRLAWGDVVGQAVSISVTFPSVPSATWTVTPLRQRTSAEHFRTSSNQYLTSRKNKPDEVKNELGTLGSLLHIGALKQFLATEPLANPVYIAVDNQGAVQVVTGAEYATITASIPIPPDPPDPFGPPTPTPLPLEP